MLIRRVILAGAAALSFLAASTTAAFAEHTVLSGTLTIDNAFFAFISTSPSVAGTLIGEGNGWPAIPEPLSNVTLADGMTYYLNIQAENYDGHGAVSGMLNLSTTGFDFENGTQNINGDAANLRYWKGAFEGFQDPAQPSYWVTPDGNVVAAHGITGGNPSFWTADQYSSSAGNIGLCGICTVDFSTEIIPVSAVSAAPEPGVWAVMCSGIAVLGAFIRKRRANAEGAVRSLAG